MKILVAMSGGVDSSVVAHLLKKQGHELIGVQFKLWMDPLAPPLAQVLPSKCCNAATLGRAKKVAEDLGVPLHHVDLSEEFKQEVVDPFLEGYRKGLTPNPCIGCNRTIKFGRLMELADELGCEKLATGHYARVAEDTSFQYVTTPSTKCLTVVMLSGGLPSSFVSALRCASCSAQYDTAARRRSRKCQLFRAPLSNILKIKRSAARPKLQRKRYCLLEAVDKSKDQSYFLYGLSQEQLSRVLFPLGSMLKQDVFALAKKFNVPLPEHYQESQDLCFFPEKTPHEFLDRYLSPPPGDIVDTEGNVQGAHRGLLHYTEGQRRGLRIGGTRIPLYVITKDIATNQLIVGAKEESMHSELEAHSLRWIAHIPSPTREHVFDVRIHSLGARHRGLLTHNGTKIRFRFQEPILGISPGQSIVLYRGEEVVGGGVIAK